MKTLEWLFEKLPNSLKIILATLSVCFFLTAVAYASYEKYDARVRTIEGEIQEASFERKDNRSRIILLELTQKKDMEEIKTELNTSMSFIRESLQRIERKVDEDRKTR